MRSVSLRQHDLCVYKSCVQSLLLQSVQQYTDESRWLFLLIQQYTNNQLRAPRRSGLHIQTLTTIISGGFKELNSTLTKTKIQTRSSSRYLRRLLVQSYKRWCKKKIQSTSKLVPVNREVLKTLEGFCRMFKNHWGQVIRKQSLYSRHEANHSHSCSTKTQGSKPASQFHYNGQDAELEARV